MKPYFRVGQIWCGRGGPGGFGSKESETYYQVTAVFRIPGDPTLEGCWMAELKAPDKKWLCYADLIRRFNYSGLRLTQDVQGQTWPSSHSL